MLFKLRFLNFHQRLEVYIGAQYAWNKIILVEVLQRQVFGAKALTCAWRPKIFWISIFLHHKPDCHRWSVGDIIWTLYSHIDHKMPVVNFLIPCILYPLPAELNFNVHSFCDVGPSYVVTCYNIMLTIPVFFSKYIMVLLKGDICWSKLQSKLVLKQVTKW